MIPSTPQNDSRLMLSLILALAVVLVTDGPAAVPVDSIDLRPALQKWELPRRAQGRRGTCSAFAITGAIEYALAEKGLPPTRLSVEFLNWGSNRTINKSRDGGFFSDLWKGFEAYGICPEEDLPYRSEFDPNLQPSPTALEQGRRIREAGLELHWIKKWNPKKGLTQEQFNAVKETLRGGKPVCGGFLWPKNAGWVDGVLEMAPREAVRDGHSVLIVGFREDPSQLGGGVFLVRNSGRGPGDSAMSYQYVRTYMNDAVWVDCGGESSSR